jgi:hypothetical protein
MPRCPIASLQKSKILNIAAKTAAIAPNMTKTTVAMTSSAIFNRVRGSTRGDHDNAETRCDQRRGENAEDEKPQQEEDQPADDRQGRNAPTQAARRAGPFDRLIRRVHHWC